MLRYLHSWCLAAALLLTTAPAFAVTLGNSFTYQGALNEAGSPATGAYDFQFALFDDASAGGQIGNTITADNVTVTAGVFTVSLNFGASQFSDEARWLQIAVRPGVSVNPYTVLTPRQLVTAAPVAQFALNGGSWRKTGSDVLHNTNDNKPVLVNRETPITSSEYFGVDAPTAGYGGMYINTTTNGGKPFYGYAQAGIDRAWTYIDGSSLAWKLNVNGGDRIMVNYVGDVGIGVPSPIARLHVETDDSEAIRGLTINPGSYGIYGSGPAAGVFGASSGGGPGIWGTSSSNTGVQGTTTTGYGIYGTNGGSNSSGFAGYFNGRVHVAGTLSKLSGSFMIDHPLDPANKTLSHSFVESPDMMNLYNGNVTTDAEGRATITLPDWFETLNRDFRYQLTPIGSFARGMVETEIVDNHFVIRTEEPNVRISWQVSGIRHDPYAAAHPIVVEAEKAAAEKGTYLFPEGYQKAGLVETKAAPKGGR